MENPTFQKDLDRATELTVVKVSQLEAIRVGDKTRRTLMEQVAASNNAGYVAGPSTSCRGEVCQSVMERFRPPMMSPSPWHNRKTYYLLITLALFAIWIVVFTVLSQLDIL